MIQIADLFVMQQSIAMTDEFQGMVDFVRDGGFFTEKSMVAYLESHAPSRGFSRASIPKLININFFEDRKKGLHDGHHRTGAILLGGREFIADEEYKTSHLTYAKYEEINPVASWVTPFSPKKEVRIEDFKEYKNHVMKLFDAGRMAEGIQFVNDNRHLYVVPRTLQTVQDMIDASTLCQKSSV